VFYQTWAHPMHTSKIPQTIGVEPTTFSSSMQNLEKIGKELPT